MYQTAGADQHDAWSHGLPTPPRFDPDLLTDDLVYRLTDACPARAIGRENSTFVLDLERCTSCGGCHEVAGKAVTPSGLVELAARDRSDLIKRIPIRQRTIVTGEQQLAAELHDRSLSLSGRGLHVRTLDSGSCAVCESEIRLLAVPHYDLHRLRLFFTPAPRHGDLLLVSGAAVRAMDIALPKTYEPIADPKVVRVHDPDQFVQGAVAEVLPVDVYVPGCPPSPLALLQGLLVAIGRPEEQVSTARFDLCEERTG